MKLYNYWRSSSSWRVRIALAIKGLPFDYVPVHLVNHGGEQHQTAYRLLNPMQEVPTLMFENQGHDVTLSQSLAIMEFIDELHPLPPLMPQDLFLRAKVRQMSQMVMSGIQPLHNLSVLQKVESLGGAKDTWAVFWLERGLRALETEAERFAGTCMVGDDVTMADACLVPQLAAARRFGVKVEAFSVLHRIEEHLQDLPPFAVAHADKQIDAPTQATA